MDASNEEETMSPIYRSNVHTAVLDTRKAYEKRLALYFILVCTLFERIAFYALMNILFTTLQWHKPLDWDVHNSQTAIFIFSGTSYISTLLFAVISDAKLGRAKTIIFGFALYLFGYTMVTITMSGKTVLCLFNETISRNTTQSGHEICAVPILTTLICTAVGAGAVESNIAVFGAEQIQESKIASRYFDKYAVAVSGGTVIAILIIPYIQYNTSGHYFIPYAVAASMLFVAGLLFILGYRYYIHVNSNETVITKCIPVVINAFKSWYYYKKESLVYEEKLDSGRLNVLDASLNHITEAEKSLRRHRRPFAFLDFAKTANNGKFKERIVDDIKTLPRAFIVFILLVPYWLVYNQTTTAFVLQGKYMQRPQKAEYIVPWMSVSNPATIIIGIIIFNKFIYKYLETRNQSLTIETKFIIGMCFASISMCIAGLVEKFRQDDCKNGLDSSSLYIYVQLLQNICMGFSQLFAMVASYEYAYLGAPLSAQSLFMSLNFCSAGISSFISTVYINFFPEPDVDLNFKCGKEKQWYWSFYTYFFILAGLQLIFTVIFIVCQKRFQIVKLNPIHIENRQSMILPID